MLVLVRGAVAVVVVISTAGAGAAGAGAAEAVAVLVSELHFARVVAAIFVPVERVLAARTPFFIKGQTLYSLYLLFSASPNTNSRFTTRDTQW